MDHQKRNRLWPLWLLLPLGTVYYFCKFVLPGYSFTALVCLCLAALFLFYVGSGSRKRQSCSPAASPPRSLWVFSSAA